MNVSALVRKMGPLIGLIVLFVVISALNSSFIDPSNLKNLLRQVSINALISFGMTFVILTGGIDLSVGSTLALSSAIMASLIKGGMDPIMGIVVAAIIGLILGTINGVVISYGKVAPFIATLATMTIFRGLTLVYTDGNPISSLTDNQLFHMFGQGYFAGIPVPAVSPSAGLFLTKHRWAAKPMLSAATKRFPLLPALKLNALKFLLMQLPACSAHWQALF